MALPFTPTGFRVTSNLYTNRVEKHFSADQEEECFKFARELSSWQHPFVSIDALSDTPGTFAVCYVGYPKAELRFMRQNTDWRVWMGTNNRGGFIGGFPLTF